MSLTFGSDFENDLFILGLHISTHLTNILPCKLSMREMNDRNTFSSTLTKSSISSSPDFLSITTNPSFSNIVLKGTISLKIKNVKNQI